MSGFTAFTVGAVLGLLYFGGLWLTVCRLRWQPRWHVGLALSSGVRLALVGLTFYLLSRGGAGRLLAGLGGLWLARCYLIRHLGGSHHGP